MNVYCGKVAAVEERRVGKFKDEWDGGIGTE
eukprot:CAMPEP_0206608164 /NCGR_PEP_ID=MMETSP0325_2-20121206/52767_1 /ASSEMBLY_ACC=CAM_ASM_000347 /TAXON_ID=2866 /ORGANISM="Crypthecodinium cohnii, Strain Seligo" /LENGTH=30 /DNA_ID= /DNA_START= /DNA_END= /DNA_ORIENTATION=